jgi:2',3'-cyclic-nucleotide 2'-phosphodiesterase (5'-nucleotidase family)
MKVLVVALFAAVSTLFAHQEEAGSPRALAEVTFLQLNDVYSTVPVNTPGDPAGAGGLARVATVKQRLAEAGRRPFMVLAGDFLSPSVASSVFKGEQMVAALNAAGLDLATLGNHEFDFGDDVLIERMKEARWQWVVSNVIDRRTGRPIGGAAPYAVRKFGGLTVGFVGLCLTTGEISRNKLTHTRLVDPLAAAARYVPILKSRGAQVIVAVTHLAFADDRRLIERFPQIDLVIGGHEHYPITATEGRALISKAGSDARWLARIDIARRSTGLVERFYELMPITSEIPDEPGTAAVVSSFETRLGVELDAVIGETAVSLDAASVRLRSSEQPIGNLFADAIREDVGADIGLTNAGSIRGDRVYPAGPIARRTLIAMHPFGSVVCKVEVTGAQLLQALNSGVSKLPTAAGQFPQVSGITLTVNVSAAPGNRVRDVKVNGSPLDLKKRYTVALPDFVLKGGDGYSVFEGLPVLVDPESGDLLVTALARHIVSTPGPLSPRVENRITLVR